MKIGRKIIAIIITLGIGFFSFSLIGASAIVVEVPSAEGNEDINIAGSTTIQGNESTVFDLIQQINKYLWRAIGAVCMGAFIYAGYNLITANGTEGQTKKAGQMMLGAAVGIIVSIISYTAVRLIINLF